MHGQKKRKSTFEAEWKGNKPSEFCESALYARWYKLNKGKDCKT